ncbi:MAG: hypothetical protein WC742_11460 [Gallionellaceae bacterium]
MHLYIYVVARDFGFAPNPYHGLCTLATCVPRIRASAQIGDWIMGVGGSRLGATGKCIYLMKVSEILTFNGYWSDIRFFRKKPLRNGSLVMMVGDNVYHQEAGDDSWIQSDSHHSNPDGTTNHENVKTDTSSENVLVSDHFYYFGKSAPTIDFELINYRNHRGHSKKLISDDNVANLIGSIEQNHKGEMNLVLDDPFDFLAASKRVDQATGKIT